MGIDLFDKLYDIAREDVADEKSYLKRIRDKNVFESMSKIEQKLQDLNKTRDELKETIKPIFNDGTKFSNQIADLNSKLKDIEDFDDVDFDKLITEYESKLEEQQSALTLEEEYRENIRPLYNQVYGKIKFFDEDKLTSDFNDFQTIKTTKTTQENQLKILDREMQSIKTKLFELEKYQYDENCDYCLDNGKQQIKQKHDCDNGLSKRKKECKELKSKYTLTMFDYDRLKNIESEKQKYDSLSDDLKQIESDAYKTHAKIKEMERDIDTTQVYLDKCRSDKLLYEENESAIKHNRDIQKQIDKLEKQLTLSTEAFDIHTQKLRGVESKILIEETNQKNLGEEIKDLVQAEQKVSDYELYLRLVSRDGIPQLIINDALHIIENEVNTVLDHMMAGFQLGITNEDKNINLYIRYDDQEWPLNLSSGMEKFVSSLALRVGLINVSNLPSPNFLVIDEGFGTLDADNLSNMKGAFDYLKTRFDSVFIISHLDTIKDFMDYLLPVNVNDGYSNIVYN